MASNFTAVNPKVLSTPSPQGLPLVYELAADAQTWEVGDWLYRSSGVWTPISGATGGVTAPYGIAAAEQATATSTSSVWVRKVEPGTRCEVYVCNNGTAAAIGAANLGTKYGLYGAAGVTQVDVNVTTDADWEVYDLAARYEPIQKAAADTPGKCMVVLR